MYLYLEPKIVFLMAVLLVLTIHHAGRPWGLVKSKVRTTYPSVQLTAWKVWCYELSYLMNYLILMSNDPNFFNVICPLMWLACIWFTVLAYRWLGELPIHAFAVPCYFPQLRCIMLVYIVATLSRLGMLFYLCIYMEVSTWISVCGWMKNNIVIKKMNEK